MITAKEARALSYAKHFYYPIANFDAYIREAAEKGQDHAFVPADVYTRWRDPGLFSYDYWDKIDPAFACLEDYGFNVSICSDGIAIYWPTYRDLCNR